MMDCDSCWAGISAVRQVLPQKMDIGNANHRSDSTHFEYVSKVWMS